MRIGDRKDKTSTNLALHNFDFRREWREVEGIQRALQRTWQKNKIMNLGNY